jgi:hypothetical protein
LAATRINRWQANVAAADRRGQAFISFFVGCNFRAHARTSGHGFNRAATPPKNCHPEPARVVDLRSGSFFQYEGALFASRTTLKSFGVHLFTI